MANNGRVPTHVPREDTGRLSADVLGATTTVGEANAAAEDDLITKFVDRVVEKLGSGSGDDPPPRKFLGVDAGGWTKMLIGYAIIGAVVIGGSWLAIRDSLAERETHTEAAERLKVYDAGHSKHPHPVTDVRLQAVEKEQQTMRESLVRRDEADKAQTEVLKGIRTDLNYLRGRRDR